MKKKHQYELFDDMEKKEKKIKNKKKLVWKKQSNGEVLCSSNNSIFRINKLSLTDPKVTTSDRQSFTWTLEVFCYSDTFEEVQAKAEKIEKVLNGGLL